MAIFNSGQQGVDSDVINTLTLDGALLPYNLIITFDVVPELGKFPVRVITK